MCAVAMSGKLSDVCHPGPNTLRTPIELFSILSVSHLLPPPSSPRIPGLHHPTLLLSQTPARPCPSPPGLVRPLPRLTPLPGSGPGAPLDRDHSGACRTRAVEPRPALSKPSAPRAEARCSRRPPSHPGFSLLRPSG